MPAQFSAIYNAPETVIVPVTGILPIDILKLFTGAMLWHLHVNNIGVADASIAIHKGDDTKPALETTLVRWKIPAALSDLASPPALYDISIEPNTKLWVVASVANTLNVVLNFSRRDWAGE
jgi:hypothetical protein